MEQMERENQILENIKFKMERIKASQMKVQGPSYHEPGSHFTGEYSFSISSSHESQLLCLWMVVPHICFKREIPNILISVYWKNKYFVTCEKFVLLVSSISCGLKLETVFLFFVFDFGFVVL